MKISKNTPPFSPITITLETPEEVAIMRHITAFPYSLTHWLYTKNKDANLDLERYTGYPYNDDKTRGLLVKIQDTLERIAEDE